jgi:4a-hydroxytetrahydrobiopterin dehydratase
MNDEKEPAGVQQQEATQGGRSLANIHTLRTALNHIIGYSEMLLEEADERGLETSLDDIRKIHAAGKRLLACIDELLDPETIDKASAQGSGAGRTIGLSRGADGDAPSVTADEIKELQPKIPEWQIIAEDAIPKLDRQFRFKSFKDAIAFTNAVGAAAEEEGHHPRLTTEWGKVSVTWWTHKIKNLHKNDFIMAAKTDAIYRKFA